MSEPTMIQRQDELMSMPWYRAYMVLDQVSVSIYTFERNYLSLVTLGKTLCDPRASSEITRLKHRDVLGGFLREMVRLLHNFTVAAKSLVAHTRRARLSFRNEGKEIAGYDDRIRSMFEEDPLTQFVQGLRNYFIHYRPPDIGLTCSWAREDPGISQVLTLSVDELWEWEEWNSRAREYLDSAGDTIDIMATVEAYRSRVKEFYEWFEAQVRELYSVEEAEFREKETQLLVSQLEWLLPTSMADAHPGTSSAEELAFHGLLRTPEFRELEALPEGSEERAGKAVELLRRHIDLPSDLEKRIRTWYAECPRNDADDGTADERSGGAV